MLIDDDVTIKVSAGKGGTGAVTFNTNMNSLGPTGGTGGTGGSVYGIAVADIGALKQFRYQKEFTAENGQDGRGQFRDGHHGTDVLLELPVGTVVHNKTTGSHVSLERVGDRALLAQGGFGGKGNFHFRSARNTSPKEFEPGSPGESFELRLELKLIADVGFVGLPNVGKSSLLNTLTNAKSKIGNYSFTTLEPNLGAYYELILADIPGLIEGSSAGKGLGIKFLRHIERTRILFHFISAESTDPEKDYATVRNELRAHNAELLNKPEYLFLTKSDLVDAATLKDKIKIITKINPGAMAISIHDPARIKKVEALLNTIKDTHAYAK